MILTVTRAIKSWRASNSHLYAVLVKHNILYYACGLFFSTVNVLTLLFLEYEYHTMFQECACSESQPSTFMQLLRASQL
ncbi:uncharacterized protein EDB91DRAFT_1183793 [Suillus paluster]|uniref:uncharacterized protein n=1 Tax=Suillus paluster TaxID=48578 RepID=UPI001B884974|nr:uncharacterized protein EDB91DRAFT_1183793 [Suillus paluster]KAG1718803.1 hypothetical protein EDB91DRAFT_1183793 [Suillus paluster]